MFTRNKSFVGYMYLCKVFHKSDCYTKYDKSVFCLNHNVFSAIFTEILLTDYLDFKSPCYSLTSKNSLLGKKSLVFSTMMDRAGNYAETFSNNKCRSNYNKIFRYDRNRCENCLDLHTVDPRFSEP